MNAHSEITADPLSKLRVPFADNQVSKLPKETRAQADARKADKNQIVWKCPECGGMHHKNAVHLDYVGHAALTDRLLDTDLQWSWEPVAWTAEGLPAFDKVGGLWIKLTVCGMTRLGYGSADGKSGGDAVKEVIGDALRNAAMRFGAALYLWHKGDLHAEPDDSEAKPAAQESAPRQRSRAADTETSTTKGPTNAKQEMEEPKGGWGDWARELIAFIGRCKSIETLDQLVDSEGDRVKASKAIDKNMFAAIVKAEAKKRDELTAPLVDDDVPF